MESECSTEEIERSAWTNLGCPAATEVLRVDVQGRLQFTNGRTAPPFLETLKRQDLLRSATVTPAAYLQTDTGTMWRVRRVHGLSHETAPDRPPRDAAPAPRERTRQLTECGPDLFVLERLWGDDPALRALLNGYGFTSREKDIALLTMRGLSNKLIGRRLGGLSPIGVRDGLRRIFAKIGACSRTEMIARILRIECPALKYPHKYSKTSPISRTKRC